MKTALTEQTERRHISEYDECEKMSLFYISNTTENISKSSNTVVTQSNFNDYDRMNHNLRLVQLKC